MGWSQNVKELVKLNPSTAEIVFSDGGRLTIDFYGENIFRLFQDPKGGIIRTPEATPPAQILVDSPRRDVTLRVLAADW